MCIPLVHSLYYNFTYIMTHTNSQQMKYFLTAALALAAWCGLSAQKPTTQPLRLEDVVHGAFAPNYIYGVRPAADGETYTQISDDGARIIRRSFKTGQEVGTLFDCNTARGPVTLTRIDGYIMSPDASKILLQTETKMIYRRSSTAVYYIFDIQNNKFERLSDGGPQQVPHFSPDGTMVAFVRANNLFLVKLLFNNAESQVTTDGKFNEVLNGIPDWVNEEEFSTNCSFDFSADSKMLAWVRYDESKVPVYSIQEYKGAYPTLKQFDEYPGYYNYKYPVAGAKNADVCVKSFDIKAGVTRTMAVPLDSDGYIPRICFTSDPEKLAVVTLNRHQDRMDIYMVNPRSTVAKLVLRETDKKYLVEAAYNDLTFYPGRFVLTSQRSGYKQLYLYDLNGTQLRRLTNGDYDVTTFYGYDPATERTYYQSAAESPLRRAVYVAEKNGKTRRLSTQVGTNAATFSTNFKYFLNVYSNLTTPPITTLCDANGKTLTTLVDNAELKQRVTDKVGTKELFSFTTPDGVSLNGWMVKPRNFDPSKKYPVIMYQYSGPGSQEVKDAWSIGSYGGGLFESYMAQNGYIFVCVDGRGTGFRGADFEKCTYLRLGEQEAKDQVETAVYLSSLPYVDGSRIGIWGWSFGGFNTLMAMSEGRPVFKAGVAVAAPSNWKYYDTVYTERYMRTPKENPGYDINPINRAAKLHGALLLVHGTADDNVHYRNCTEYAEALVQANKQFQMQIYTNRNHFINGGNTRLHLYERMTQFFFDNL